MIVYCKRCGKKCKTRPCKVARGEVDPDDFFCHSCTIHRSYPNRHLDMRNQRWLKYAASVYKKKEDGDGVR